MESKTFRLGWESLESKTRHHFEIRVEFSSQFTKLALPTLCCNAKLLSLRWSGFTCSNCGRRLDKRSQPLLGSYYLTNDDRAELRSRFLESLEAHEDQEIVLEANLIVDKLVDKTAAWVRKTRRDLRFEETLRLARRRHR